MNIQVTSSHQKYLRSFTTRRCCVSLLYAYLINTKLVTQDFQDNTSWMIDVFPQYSCYLNAEDKELILTLAVSAREKLTIFAEKFHLFCKFYCWQSLSKLTQAILLLYYVELNYVKFKDYAKTSAKFSLMILYQRLSYFYSDCKITAAVLNNIFKRCLHS